MRTDVRQVDMGLGLTRALSVAAGNSTAGSFTTKVPTITKPSGAGIFDLKAMKETVARYLSLIFFGQGTANQTFNCRLTGWQPVGELDPYFTLWMPRTLVEFACTLGAATGVAGAQLVVADKIVDGLSLTTGNNNVDVEFISPADDTVAHALVDLKGSHLIEITFDMVNATSGNALFSIL